MATKMKEIMNTLRDKNELIDLAVHRCHALDSLNLFTSKITTTTSSTKTGSLTGIPVSVKDNFCTVDFPTTCSSEMLRNFRPGYDATVVARMLREGAVLVGKNNMDEFAMGSGTTDSCFGPSKNPWSFRDRLVHRGSLEDETAPSSWHVCGGSSGGSAAAVAAGVVMAALGSDTGGSTRLPASHCGVVGLKPTYGRLSRHGLIPLVNSLDSPGILTRTVDDAAHILNVIGGHDPLDSTSVVPDALEDIVLPDTPQIHDLVVGVPQEYFHPELDPDVLECWIRIGREMEKAGARLVSVSLPHMRFSIITYSVLCCCEIASNMARYDGLRYGHRDPKMDSTEEMYARSRSFGFNDVVRGRIFAGNHFLSRRNYVRYFAKAQTVRRLIADELFRALAPGAADVLLTPTTTTPALTFEG